MLPAPDIELVHQAPRRVSRFKSSRAKQGQQMRFDRQGSGTPLLLIHGLGSSRRTWGPVVPMLAAQRELIAVDLPGFGDTPGLA